MSLQFSVRQLIQAIFLATIFSNFVLVVIAGPAPTGVLEKRIQPPGFREEFGGVDPDPVYVGPKKADCIPLGPD
ncbi:hypothetical protein H4219_006320, partial [Mycoemilia scoparia]